MMNSQRMVSTVLLVVIVAFLAVEKADGLIHIVGGGFGWQVPPNTTFYQQWAKPRTFGVGDELVFPFTTGAQTVIQVDKKDFDTCGRDDVINEYYVGPARIKLDKVGGYYFYSDVGLHCEGGQKLAVEVVNGPGSSGMFFGRKLLAIAAESATNKAHDASAAPGPADVATAPAAGPDTSATTDGASNGSNSASGGGDKPAVDNKASAAAGSNAMAAGISAFISFAFACIAMM